MSTKLTNLPTGSPLSVDSLLYVVHDPSGSPQSENASLGDLRSWLQTPGDTIFPTPSPVPGSDTPYPDYVDGVYVTPMLGFSIFGFGVLYTTLSEPIPASSLLFKIDGEYNFSAWGVMQGTGDAYSVPIWLTGQIGNPGETWVYAWNDIPVAEQVQISLHTFATS